MKIVQAYARTYSQYDDGQTEQFYEDVELAMRKVHTQYTLVIGDFNAKVGKRRLVEKQFATMASILETLKKRC